MMLPCWELMDETDCESTYSTKPDVALVANTLNGVIFMSRPQSKNILSNKLIIWSAN